MHLIYLAVGIEWIDGMVFVSNASVAARFELAFQTNTVSCIIGIIPTEFQTTRFNWIKPRPTRNQLTSTRLSTPFLIPFRIINLSPSINRRRIAIVCTKILYPLLLSPLCNPISREFFSTIPSTPTHTIPRNFHQTHEFQIRSKCLSSEVPPPRVTLTRTLSSKLSIAGNVLILK